jgi:hypothetical protein
VAPGVVGLPALAAPDGCADPGAAGSAAGADAFDGAEAAEEVEVTESIELIEVLGTPEAPDVGSCFAAGAAEEAAAGPGVNGAIRLRSPSSADPAAADLSWCGNCGLTSAKAATAAVERPPMAIGAGRRGLNGLRLERCRAR